MPFAFGHHASLHLSEARSLLEQVSPAAVAAIAYRLAETVRDDGQILVAGNGGSAATAAHFVTDLTNASPRVRARALADNVALLTATANDRGYDRVFSQQIERHGRSGDILVVISGSGNSPNVLAAVRAARERGLFVVGLCGFAGGRLAPLCDLSLVVDASAIQLVEDVHSVVTHAIARTFAADLQGAASGGRRAVFLDRDGVINERRATHVRGWDDFRFLPGALEGLRLLATTDMPIVVVTNQAVVGRDGLPAQAVDLVHARMQAEIEAAGGRIDAIYVCTHDPKASCDCRKPRAGLLLRAAADLGIDLGESVLVGDSGSDVLAARSVGCLPLLVASDPVPDTRRSTDVLCTSDLLAAARLILSRQASALARKEPISDAAQVARTASR